MLLEESLGHDRALWDPQVLANTLHSLGWVMWIQGDAARATRLSQEALALFRDLGEKDITHCLVMLGVLASDAGRYRRAARLCGAAAARSAARRGGEMVVEVRDEYAATVAAARAHLDGATFAAAWAAGEGLTREQAIAYALDDDGPAA